MALGREKRLEVRRAERARREAIVTDGDEVLSNASYRGLSSTSLSGRRV